MKEATENPVIIHFTTSFLSRRPWIEGCQHRYVGEWMKYKNMSPWKDEELWEHKKVVGVKGIGIKLARKLPGKLIISVTGIAQAYVRPIINRIKN